MIDLASLTLLPSREIEREPALLPDASGVYFIFFDSGQLLLEQSGYLDFDLAFPPSIDGYDLLYAGGARRLRPEVLRHLLGGSTGSTLRMTVGAILTEALRPESAWGRDRADCRTCIGERQLTDWLLTNTQIGFRLCEAPFAELREVLKVAPAPLTLSSHGRHPYAKHLGALRNSFTERPQHGDRTDEFAVNPLQS